MFCLFGIYWCIVIVNNEGVIFNYGVGGIVICLCYVIFKESVILWVSVFGWQFQVFKGCFNDVIFINIVSCRMIVYFELEGRNI